jgi:ribosome-associated protein
MRDSKPEREKDDGDAEQSRSARKRASHEIEELGEELVELRPDRFATLELPERLAEAVAEAKRLTSFGARRRQARFIGKLMRGLEPDELAAIRKAVASQ